MSRLFRRTALLLALALGLSGAALAEEPYECAVPLDSLPEGFVVRIEREEPVADEWFADALIMGDSITEAMGNYGVQPDLDYVTLIGQSPQGAWNNHNFRAPDGRWVTMTEFVAMKAPHRLLIMLGSNGLDHATVEHVLNVYHQMLDYILVECPETQVYLLTVTPIAAHVDDYGRGALNLDKITRFNEGLLAMAEAHGLHYVDIYTPLLQEGTTWLAREHYAGDGIHLNRSGSEAVIRAISLQVTEEDDER